MPPIQYGNPLANHATNNTTAGDAEAYIDFKTQVNEQLAALHKETGDKTKFKAAVALV